MMKENPQTIARDGYGVAGPALILIVVVSLVLAGCGAPPQTDTQPANEDTAGQPGGTGTLEFRANGEDFVRQGFASKDGWAISFDHVYVTLADITAYQADPPFDALEGGMPESQVTASLNRSHTVDLAEGDENAEPLMIDAIDAPAGRYNALSWSMVEATDGPASGGVIVMQGTATKDGETIDFTIRLGQEEVYYCGDYVGDERKGILEPDSQADLEATFHFDHVFGDGDLPADDELNRDALGFAPFAALAEQGSVDADMEVLNRIFSAEEREKLMNLHLAHVGEGHCHSSEE